MVTSGVRAPRSPRRRSWLDISYVFRLVHLPCHPLNPRLDDAGDKRRPSRDTVIRLGLPMQLPMEDMDELLIAARYVWLVRWWEELLRCLHIMGKSIGQALLAQLAVHPRETPIIAPMATTIAG